MASIRWNTFDLRNFLEEDLELPSALSRLGLTQGLNIYETKDNIVAEAVLAGISEDMIDVSIDNKIVRITGTRETKKEDRDQYKNLMSTIPNTYNYSFKLPENVSGDIEPECQLNNGLLKLSFPKSAKEPPKKIKITQV